MIDLRDVSYRYEDGEALRHVDLHISRGESVAFIGPNGSGKSTLLKLLNGIIAPHQGSYFFENVEITGKKLRDSAFAKRFHQKIGFLFQNADAQLFCPAVYDEVAFGPRQMGFSEGEVDARVLDCLKLMNIEHLKTRIPYHLSEGEKRKVAFASVLALNPDVLALDEPMNGLDARTKRFIREVIRALHAAGKTILCSTHDFKYVEGLFVRGIVISDGHTIVRDDDYGAILADTDFLTACNIL